MKWIAYAAVVLGGLFSLLMGLGAVLSPESLGEALGVAAASDTGRSTLRADLGTFFLVSAVASIRALLSREPHWLYGAALIYGSAATLRTLDAIIASAPEGIVVSIGVEIVLCAGFLFSAVQLGRIEATARTPG
ncbi:MAG: hypothetical protein V2J24_09295 [Pseudomonadales bacterium]|jgi:hypothetical protein|nr:hypothetical protein [Pseudomonadales bacterium]